MNYLNEYVMNQDIVMNQDNQGAQKDDNC